MLSIAVCHELRNPLHVLKSTLDSLLQPDDDDDTTPLALAPATTRTATAPQGPGAPFNLKSLCDSCRRQLSSQSASGSVVSSTSVVRSVHELASERGGTGSRSPDLARAPSLAGTQLEVAHPAVPTPSQSMATSQWALSPAQQRKQMVTDVLQALDRMEATVNDVLDFRKLDANMFSMSRKPVVVRDLIDSVCRHCRPFLKAHVQFGYRVSPADAVAMIDHRRMFQIIINGLSNAGKFTNSGAVAVDVTLTGGGVGVPQYLVVTVSNTSGEAKLKDPEALFVPFRGTHEGATPAAAGEWSSHARIASTTCGPPRLLCHVQWAIILRHSSKCAHHPDGVGWVCLHCGGVVVSTWCL